MSPGADDRQPTQPASLPAWLDDVPAHKVVRIDVGLEGQWSETVTAVWSVADGFRGFDDVAKNHPTHRPAVELYLEDGWIGVPCSIESPDGQEFDEALARDLIAYVERRRR